MQDRPIIKTATPKHRYQVGGQSAILLGDIESGDGRGYKYILAFVPAGQGEPVLYLCAERTDAGAYDLRVVGELMSDVLDTGVAWGDVEAFAQQALRIGMQMLGLTGQQVVQLM